MIPQAHIVPFSYNSLTRWQPDPTHSMAYLVDQALRVAVAVLLTADVQAIEGASGLLSNHCIYDYLRPVYCQLTVCMYDYL